MPAPVCLHNRNGIPNISATAVRVSQTGSRRIFLKVSAPYYWPAYIAQTDLKQNHFSPSETAANAFN
jgi:hypothetical protein